MKFSYIINYSENQFLRRKNLFTVLKNIEGHLDVCEIIIVEQGKDSKIEKSDIYKHVFVYNQGLYNRAWGLNVGAKASNCNIIVFADSDLIINFDDLLSSIEKCEKYEAVNPKGKVIMTTKDNEKTIAMPGVNFSGGLLVMKKTAFDFINGWDEDFRGWGGEDDAMSRKIERMIGFDKIISLDFEVIHLFHFNLYDTNQKFYKDNVSLLTHILKLSKEELFKRYENRLIGDSNKYVNE